MNNLRLVHPVQVTQKHIDTVPNLITNLGPESRIMYIGNWDRGEVPPNIVQVDPTTLYSIFGIDTKLPYSDGTFDACICVNILGNIENPFLLARDIIRILVPGGHIYVEVPFIAPYDTTKRDFYRFTPRGLEVLFTGATIEEVGIVNGPGSTMHWIKSIYDALLYERDGKIEDLDTKLGDSNYLEAYTIMAIHNEGIKSMDTVLSSREHACTIATSLHLLGRKKLEA